MGRHSHDYYRNINFISMIIIAAISILILSLLVWIANRFLPFRICPICAGVSGTWIWLIVSYFQGYQVDLTIPALLMGGSVVGLSYQLEKIAPHGKSVLLWKILFIPAGFTAAYGILVKEWLLFAVAIIFLLAISFSFLPSDHKPDSDKETIVKLKQKMEECC